MRKNKRNLGPGQGTIATNKLTELKKIAENLVRESGKKFSEAEINKNIDELIHDLEVYQIELEIQNNELIETQKQLNESLNSYFELYNEAPAGYITLDREGVISDLNLEALRIFSKKKEKILNQMLLLHLPRETHQTFLRQLKAAHLNKTTSYAEIKIPIDDDDRILKFSIKSNSGESGKLAGFKIIVEDITDLKMAESIQHNYNRQLEKEVEKRTKELQKKNLELRKEIKTRKKTEELLKLSEEKYRLLFENSASCILVTNNDGKYVDANNAAEKLLEYGKQELLNFSIKDLTPGSYKKLFKDKWDTFIKNGYDEGIYLIKTKSGKNKLIEYKAVANFLPGYHLSLMNDITEQEAAASEREAAIKLLSIANSKQDIDSFIFEIGKTFKQWADCDSIKIKFMNGENIEYTVSKRMSKGVFKCYPPSESLLQGNGKAKENTDCICGITQLNITGEYAKYFSTGGSFVTGSVKSFIKSFSGKNNKVSAKCLKEGFESLAIIPLKADGKTFGLLQLNNKKKGKFTIDSIAIFERLADNLAIALSQKLSQYRLRKSEIKHRNLFETMVQGVLYLDDKCNIKEANPAAAVIFGKSEDELKKLNCKKIFGEFVDEKLNRLDDKISPMLLPAEEINENKSRVVGLYSSENEKYRWISVNVIPQFFDNSSKASQVYVIIEDITERKKSEEQIKRSLVEKEVLLKEIHHRVKNNLQIISSLLSLQTRVVKDPEIVTIFHESQNRIKSMALIHEQMYRAGNFETINLKNYIKSMVDFIHRSFRSNSGELRIITEIDDINLSMDYLVPCGLIINELISNSIKHAFEHNKPGMVKICFYKKDTFINLKIEDNGKGFPAGFDLENCDTLGLLLVNTLVTQIKGKLEFKSSENGTEFNINFGVNDAV